MGSREPHRTRTCDVDRRARGYACRVAAVVAGGEDVREHGEVQDLLHRLLFVRELEQVEVREGDHHVLGLPADPATHVHVAVGRARPRRVDVEADAGLALLAVAAATAGYVEGYRAEVADVYELYVVTLLDDLARDLVPQRLPDRGRRPAAHHMLIGAADVGRDNLEYRGVRSLFGHPHCARDLFGDLELRVLDVLYRYLPWSLVDHYPVVSQSVILR